MSLKNNFRKLRKKLFDIRKMPRRISFLEESISINARLLSAIDEAIKTNTNRLSELEKSIHLTNQTVNILSTHRRPRKVVKVVFLVHNMNTWDSYADVVTAMMARDEFDPIVVSVNRRFPNEPKFSHEDETHRELVKRNIPHIRLGMENSYEGLEILKSIAPDIIFRQSQWDADLPPGFSTHALNFARLCYIPYAVLAMLRTELVGSGERDLVSDTDWHRSCWRIFYATPKDVLRIKNSSAMQDMNVVATGHPKVMRLIHEGMSNPYWPINHHDKAKKARFRVIWSPHHSIGKNWNNFGTFPYVYKDILEWAKSDDSVDIVLSLHPALLGMLYGPDCSCTKEEIDDFFSEWEALPNTSTFRGGDYAHLMAASDCLISDGLSFLMEYQFFEKPVIFIKRPDHVPFSDNGEKVIEGVHPVASAPAAISLVKQFQNGLIDEKKEKQKDLISYLTGAGDAVGNILSEIKRGLQE